MKATYTFVCFLLAVIVTASSFSACSALSAEEAEIISLTEELLLSELPEGASRAASEDPLPQEDVILQEISPEEVPTITSDPPAEEPPLRAEVPTDAPTEEETADIFTYPASDYKCYTAVCATANVNVRAGYGTDKSIVGHLGVGRSLPYLETVKGWYKVWLDGEVGYISAAYSYLSDTCRAIERILSAGLSKVDTPYVWGAPRIIDENGEVSPYFTGKSFDCSSFVQYCYYVGDGVKLGNYTGSQADYTVGKVIKRYEELRRGDFYFTGSGSISHVVIYMGGGYLLQAYSANGGPVSFTTDDRWKGKFISGRRVDLTVKEQYGAKAADR